MNLSNTERLKTMANIALIFKFVICTCIITIDS